MTISDPRKTPSPAELDDMTPDEKAVLAAELDDVHVARNRSKWPLPGTRAERRAERSVAAWFAISAISGLAFIGSFLFWPYQYKAPGQPGYDLYALYTPIVGGTFGLSVLAVGIGVIAYVKKFFPDEVSIQQRHDGASDELARQTVVAQVVKAGKDTGIARRSLIVRSAGAAAGVLGLGLGVASIAPLVRNPWKDGPNSPLWVTGWKPVNNETVYLRRDTGIPHEISLVRPEDLEAGSMETVFPFRESERGDDEALLKALRRSDNPVLLIRLRPGTPTVPRKGQETFNYGDYWAYSKVCTHLGCPTSLYEAQTQRLLCPCHQSQFLATEHGKPIFGPATRPLPQLPITVNNEGFLVARSDFVEPIGPAFWERRYNP
jgi:ubiquinol-cytochrome c reductase iron-sulfur subunit